MPNMQRLKRNLSALLATHRDKAPYVIGAALIFCLYVVSKGREVVHEIYHSEKKVEFKDSRILGGQMDSLAEGKERLFMKTIRDIQTSQAELRESIDKMKTEIENVKSPKPGESTDQGPYPVFPVSGPSSASPLPIATGSAIPVTTGSGQPETTKPEGEPVKFHSGENLPVGGPPKRGRSVMGLLGNGGGNGSEGSLIISFPVKDNSIEKIEGVVLPAGSYVKAKLMTGIEAPEGKTYPVLLQLDYAYIAPNKHRIDLAGCFMITKSEGDLSTERVQMQATKLSCVSKDGKMFERDVNGFVADDQDNSFAVIGSVNSKQDRVAAMAFLSSIVEGVGKAVQQAQTSQQTNALGAAQTMVTGDQAKYLAAGGASGAASLVAQWYLKQAEHLLPTINVGSGRDVWVVMKDSVRLPTDYFRNGDTLGAGAPGQFLFTRVLE
ncbi:TraB/VirB10 family protein [Bdellovibrionota bacterium FG-2]